MNLSTLRSKYTSMTAQERAELFLSKAIPKKDESLAEALKAGSLYDAYNMIYAEMRMLMFGSYWLSKLCYLSGIRGGMLISNNREDDFLEERAAALATVLDEFDKQHGGWLRGIACILNCNEVLDNSLELADILSKIENDLPFHHHKISYDNEIKTLWNDINVAKQ